MVHPFEEVREASVKFMVPHDEAMGPKTMAHIRVDSLVFTVKTSSNYFPICYLEHNHILQFSAPSLSYHDKLPLCLIFE